MLLLPCPNCGGRNVQEYRYGGEYNPRPPNPLETEDGEWADYVFMQRNKLGLQLEWWYHAAGCGIWFLAERHTQSNEVRQTFMWNKDLTGFTNQVSGEESSL